MRNQLLNAAKLFTIIFLGYSANIFADQTKHYCTPENVAEWDLNSSSDHRVSLRCAETSTDNIYYFQMPLNRTGAELETAKRFMMVSLIAISNAKQIAIFYDPNDLSAGAPVDQGGFGCPTSNCRKPISYYILD